MQQQERRTKMPIYNYATTTLQQEQISQLEALNNKIEQQNNLIGICAFILVLTYVTAFVRNIF